MMKDIQSITSSGMTSYVLHYTEFDDFLSETAPKILYKYRNWKVSLHRRILENNEFYFAPPDNFDDPADCRLPIDFNVTLEEAWKHIQFFDSKKVDDMTRREKRKSVWEVLHNKNRQKKFEETRYQLYCKKVGIFCLSKKSNTKEMWNKYANQSGFCVGFYTKELCREIFGGGGAVEYVQTLPSLKCTLSWEEEYCRNIFTKLATYSKEYEYRLLKPLNSNRRINYPESILAHVILAPDIDKDDENEIREMMSQLHPQVPIYNSIEQNGKIVKI